jgi:hypothetical protein
MHGYRCAQSMPSNSGPPPRAKGTGKLTRETARAIGKKGGHAKALKRKLMDTLGLLPLEKDATFAPYRDMAEAYRKELTRQFCERFGSVDAAASATISSACLQLAASRWCFGAAAGRRSKLIQVLLPSAEAPGEEVLTEIIVRLSGDPEIFLKGSRLAADARASLVAAWEWCERVKPPPGKPGEPGGQPGALPAWMTPT